MTSAEVAALCAILNLQNHARKEDNLEEVETYLASLAPKDFPLTRPRRAQTAPTVTAPPPVCNHPKCSRLLDGSRRYFCSKHHKQEFIALWRDNEPRDMGVYLATLLLFESMRTRENNLQPLEDFNQVVQPPQLARTMTNMEVFKLYDPYIDLLLAVLGVKLDGSPNAAQEDQRIRATELASMFYSGRYTTVRLMDGHGGFLFLFIRELIKKFKHNGMRDKQVTKLINDISFEVVDIVDSVTAWHARMYPAFTCLTEDIFTRCRLSNKTLLYANFCGVSKSWEGVKDFLKDMKNLKMKEMMLSFANRRSSQYHQSLNKICGNARLCKEKLKTNRHNFHTYIISGNTQL